MKLDSIGNYCMYLRKSRKDIEAEKHGEGETLKRHFEMLMSLANRLKIIIREDAIYKEIVSGDTIASVLSCNSYLQILRQGNGMVFSL